jgi:hypothetical protein
LKETKTPLIGWYMSIPRLSGKNKQRTILEIVDFQNASSCEQNGI